MHYVYILASKKNGTLYIGTTRDLEHRVWEHKQGVNSGFTKKYNIKILVYYEGFDLAMEAVLREKQMKKWHRLWKLKLIEQENPEWNDLSTEWYD
jgi:putative endonuclease